MPELPNYITPDQLKEIGQTIATAIAAAKDLPSITFAELNDGRSIDLFKGGLKAVATEKYLYGYVLNIDFAFSTSQVYIGYTNSTGDTSTLAAPNIFSYGKQPGMSIAIRHYVRAEVFDTDVVPASGVTNWRVSQIADYNGLMPMGADIETITDDEIDSMLAESGIVQSGNINS